MNAPINLVHLKFFCDAALYGSISESAKKNYVTQSTVSQAIIKLERILGVELISHAKQKFNLTDEGRAVFEKARQVFKAVQDIHDQIDHNKEEISGTLKFISTNSLGMSFLAPVYKKMQEQFPLVNLDFSLSGLNFIRNSLRQGEVDFAIVVYDRDFSQFSKHLLKKGKFNLYQRFDAPHHLLENGILIDHREGMHISELQNYFVESDKNSLKIQAELAGWEVVARFTEMNIGIGFFPDYITDNDRYPNIKIHPQQIPSMEYEICAIFNKGDKPSRAATAFFDIFAKEYSV